MPASDDQQTDLTIVSTAPPPGEFVSDDLARDCARFLEDIRRRAGRAEGNAASSEN